MAMSISFMVLIGALVLGVGVGAALFISKR